MVCYNFYINQLQHNHWMGRGCHCGGRWILQCWEIRRKSPQFLHTMRHPAAFLVLLVWFWDRSCCLLFRLGSCACHICGLDAQSEGAHYVDGYGVSGHGKALTGKSGAEPADAGKHIEEPDCVLFIHGKPPSGRLTYKRPIKTLSLNTLLWRPRPRFSAQCLPVASFPDEMLQLIASDHCK